MPSTKILNPSESLLFRVTIQLAIGIVTCKAKNAFYIYSTVYFFCIFFFLSELYSYLLST